MGLLVNKTLDELKKNETRSTRTEKQANYVFYVLLKVSAAVNTFHKVKEEKCRFLAELWLEK